MIGPSDRSKPPTLYPAAVDSEPDAGLPPEGRRIPPATGLLVLAGLVLVSWLARDQLGLSGGPSSVRDLVARAGIWGPLVFVVLAGFRHLLLIPSQVFLLAAGVLFGLAWGTIYGAAGMLISALLYFGFARWLGRDAILTRARPRLRAVLSVLGERPGAFFVAALTAYPIGVTPAYWTGAGLTDMAWTSFAFWMSFGVLVRSAIYVTIGSALFTAEPALIAAALGALVLMIALPLAFPGVRSWFRRLRNAGTSAR